MIKEFTIGFSRTINLGRFNSAKVEAHITIETPSGKINASLRGEAQEQLRRLLEDTWNAQYKPPAPPEVKKIS